MKLHAEIGDAKYEIEIKRDGDAIRASIDGEPFDAEISQPERNVFLFKKNGRTIEAFVEPGFAIGQSVNVWISGNEHSVRLADPKRLRGSEKGSEQDQGRAEIRSAMPGKVVRLLVAAGTEVEKGAGVIVVEAMKMQNELKAPKSGTVTSIKVKVGDTVSAGEVLAAIE
jgi:biotin carboxyl carrier protein